MTQNAVDLLIRSRPLWHQAAPREVPVSVKQVYGVLGRRNQRWESILSTTDDMHIARRTMEAANTAGIFDRIVITQGHSVDNAPAGKWETIECALPMHRVVTGDSFNVLLQKMQTQTANTNPEYSVGVQTPLIGEKQTHTFALMTACVLGALNLSASALVFVALLAFSEMIFLSNKHLIASIRMKTVNRFRAWFYALLNGALLAPLVLNIF